MTYTTLFYITLCTVCEHPIKLGQAMPGMVADWHHEDVSVCRENIRADERSVLREDTYAEWVNRDIEAQMRKRLRAQVEVLRGNNRTADWDYHRALDDVLAMLGGES